MSVKNNLKETTFELFVGNWHIDVEFAFQEISNYFEKIQLLDSGATIFDLFGAAKQESKLIKVVDSEGGTTVIDSLKESPENSILELSYSGVMRDEDGLCSYGINSLTEQLYQAYSNTAIKGILLNINSGGGESNSGYTLQQAIADKNKPVVVRTPFLASAALNGASTATEIIGASDAARVGSIGSYMTINRQALEDYKNDYMDIYATVSPDKNKAIRDAILGDFSLLTKQVTQNAVLFQNTIKKNLNLNEKLMESTLAGDVFYAQDAKKRGLIHSVGSKKFAIKRIFSHIKYQ